jgi:mRNA-degrading endonuclease RelE of RelBE toxin-antitoxin system
MSSRVFMVIVGALSLLLCVVGADTIFVARNREYIKSLQTGEQRARVQADRIEQNELTSIRVLDYRLCVRINDTRGVVVITTASAHVSRPHLVSDLPLYNCEPGINDGARLLTPAQDAAYLRLLERGKPIGP